MDDRKLTGREVAGYLRKFADLIEGQCVDYDKVMSGDMYLQLPSEVVTAPHLIADLPELKGTLEIGNIKDDIEFIRGAAGEDGLDHLYTFTHLLEILRRITETGNSVDSVEMEG